MDFPVSSLRHDLYSYFGVNKVSAGRNARVKVTAKKEEKKQQKRICAICVVSACDAFRRVDLTTSALLLLPVVIVIIISSFLLFFLLLRANSSPTSVMTGHRDLARTQLELLRHVLDLSLRHSALTQNNSPHRFYFQWVAAQAFTDGYWPHVAPQGIYSNGIFSG